MPCIHCECMTLVLLLFTVCRSSNVGELLSSWDVSLRSFCFSCWFSSTHSYCHPNPDVCNCRTVPGPLHAPQLASGGHSAGSITSGKTHHYLLFLLFITSVYFFYCALYLIVSPTLIVAWMSSFAAIFASSLVCITILLHTLDFSCKTCSFGKITKGLAFLLLGLFSIAINFYLLQQVKRDKQASQDATRDLLRTVVSSIVIGIYGYAVKKLLFPKKGVEETERGNQEMKPLIGE